MGDKDVADKPVESRGQEPGDNAEEKGRSEALAGSEEYNRQQQENREAIKDGTKHSGITGEIGKVELVDAQASMAKQIVVERNDAGQVSRVERANGEVQEYQYTNGQLSRVEYPDHTSWRRENDQKWHLYDANGQRTNAEVLQGDMRVDNQGNFTFEDNFGTKEIQRPDGSYRREYANGGSFERNADNEVTSVTTPDGQTHKYSYENGRLSRVEYPDHTSWRRQTDGSWRLHDAAGNRTNEPPLQGDMRVDSHGNFVFENSNGQRETTGADGSYVRHNASGQVERVTRPDGAAQEIQYGTDGRVSRVTDERGSSWRREANGEFRLYDANGTRSTGEALQGDIQVDREGNHIFVHKDGMREITRPNGSVQRVNTDGSVREMSGPSKRRK